MVTVTPIGTISTPFESTSDAPRQGHRRDAVGTITIDDAFLDGLTGIDVGDDVIVLWWAHEADRDVISFDRDGPRGVFSTRSPARPNPVCLTTCRVLDRTERTLTVEGVDMKTGSPVLDLKPALDPDKP